MRKVWVVVLVTLVGTVAAWGAPQPKVVYVRCGKLIFDAEKPAISPAVVVITDGKVSAVGKDIAVPAGAEQIDLSSFTVLPGFVDAHIPFGLEHSGSPFGATGGAAREQGDELCAFFRRCWSARYGHAGIY